MRDRPILAIDQGTTSSRAILFELNGRPLAADQRPLRQVYPREGWVEHDPEEIWRDTLAACEGCLAKAGLAPGDLTAIGITNQRETVLAWDAATGRPLHNAIVWQDRRTAARCRELDAAGHAADIRARTGLVIDPYFSATKAEWLLANVAGLRAKAGRGEALIGTVDSWLVWRLTGGAAHLTDATNAARTMLYGLRGRAWDPALLDLFGVPERALAEVRDCTGPFGETDPRVFGAAIPIAGMAGDQHAALVGQACLSPGMVKCTYGTGAFALVHMGGEFVESNHRLLTTLAYRVPGEEAFAMEGSVFVAGATVQWLRDQLGLIREARESEALAASIADTGGVYLVPAFVGLGAPWWDASARGALIGLNRDSGAPQIVRAALEAQGYQTRDLLDAMASDLGRRPEWLRVDGGMVGNDWMCQFLSDMTGLAVERPAVIETTALGAAALAGLGAGLHGSTADIARSWRAERVFEPGMDEDRRESLYAGWRAAVARVRTDG